MSSLKTLLLAIEQAERRRHAAKQELARAEQAWLAARDQLAQLQGYASETEARWGAQSHRGAGPELLRHHYQFMGRLQHATGLQASVIEQRALAVQTSRQALVVVELRLAALTRVQDARRAELAREQQRRERLEDDEIAAVQYRNGAGRGLGGRIR